MLWSVASSSQEASPMADDASSPPEHARDRAAPSDAAQHPAQSTTRDSAFASFLAALASSPPPYRSPRLEANDVFADRYRIERELGRGGMGIVYLADDRSLERKVALKVAAGRSSEVELARLQQEARVMAKLSDPGIVTVFEAGMHEEHVFLAMEFVPGGTLRDWMDVESRSWRTVVRMFIDVARPLAAAHRAGIVHRDFKPHNVLLGLEGRPKIADFGLARLPHASSTHPGSSLGVSSLTVTGAALGTPAYMAPEQADGQEATPASDQFSFFVTLYEALTGARPYTGKTVAALMLEVTSKPPPDPPGVPRRLTRLLRRGLAFSPVQRCASMDDVVRELEAIVSAPRRRARTLAVVGGLSLAGSIGFASALSVEPEPCAVEHIQSATARVWNEEVQASVRRMAGRAVTQSLDTYADELTALRRQACLEHEVEQTLSDEDFALRSACLDRAQARLQGLLDDVTAHPDGLADDLADDLAENLAQRVLPRPEGCSDTTALRRLSNRHARVSARSSTRADTAYAEGLRLLTLAKLRSGRGEDTQELIERLEALAIEHELPGLHAHALLMRAAAELDPQREAKLLSDALDLARATRDTDLLSEIALQRSVAALRRGELGPSTLLFEQAETLAELGSGESRSEADRLGRAIVAAKLHNARGRSAEAVDTLRGVLAELDPSSLEALEARSLLADALLDQGRFTRAEGAYRVALEHPLATDPFLRFGLGVNRSLVHRFAGDFEGANASLDAAERELSGLEDIPAELRAPLVTNRAAVARLRGELERAEGLAQEARRLLESVDPQHPSLGYVFDELGALARERGEFKGSQAWLAQSLERWDAARGPGSIEAAGTLVSLAETFSAQGRPERAVQAADAALEIFATLERPQDERAQALLVRGRALETLDDPRAAASLAEARESCRDSARWDCRRIRRDVPK